MSTSSSLSHYNQDLVDTLNHLAKFLSTTTQHTIQTPPTIPHDDTTRALIDTYKLTNEIFTLCLQSKLTEMKALIQQYNNNNNNNNNNKEQQQQQQQQKSLNLSYWSTIDMSLYKNQFMNNNYTINHFFTSLLHFAIISQSIEMIEYVLNELNFKTSINQQDLDGYTALTYAVIIGNIDIIQLLIEEYNADPTIISIHGEKLYHFALLTNNIDIIEYILSLTPIPFIECDNKDNNNNKDNKNNNKNNKNNNNNKMGQDDDEDDDEDDEDDEEQLPQLKLDDPLMETCIMKLASNASLISIDFLSFDLDIDLNFQNSILLKYAILSGSIELVDFLINEHGLNVHYIDVYGQPLLFDAINNNHWDLFRHLIEKYQCDPTLRCLHSDSTILQAALKPSSTITIDLIDYMMSFGIDVNFGIDIDELDHDVKRPCAIYRAAMIGNFPIFKHLIQQYNAKILKPQLIFKYWCSYSHRENFFEIIQFLIDECHVELKPKTLPGEIIVKTWSLEKIKLFQKKYKINTNNTNLFKVAVCNKDPTVFDDILQKMYTKDGYVRAILESLLWEHSPRGNINTIEYILNKYSDLLLQEQVAQLESNTTLHPQSLNMIRQAILLPSLINGISLDKYRTFIHRDDFICNVELFPFELQQQPTCGITLLLFALLTSQLPTYQNHYGIPGKNPLVPSLADIRYLIEEKNAQINCTLKSSENNLLHSLLLFVHSQRYIIDIFDYLIRIGVNIHYNNKKWTSPLRALVLQNYQHSNSFLRYILNNHSATTDINNQYKDPTCPTLLHYLISEGKTTLPPKILSERVELLLSHNNNADVNIKNNYGYTPFLYAVSLSQWDIATTIFLYPMTNIKLQHNQRTFIHIAIGKLPYRTKSESEFTIAREYYGYNIPYTPTSDEIDCADFLEELFDEYLNLTDGR